MVLMGFLIRIAWDTEKTMQGYLPSQEWERPCHGSDPEERQEKEGLADPLASCCLFLILLCWFL